MSKHPKRDKEREIKRSIDYLEAIAFQHVYFILRSHYTHGLGIWLLRARYGHPEFEIVGIYINEAKEVASYICDRINEDIGLSERERHSIVDFAIKGHTDPKANLKEGLER